MDKKKMKDPQIWLRMAGELAALETLVDEIFCDHEYNEVMDRNAWNHLSKAIREINEVRCRADTRAARYIFLFGPEPFYGDAVRGARDLVAGFRESLRSEAVERAERIYEIKEDAKA